MDDVISTDNSDELLYLSNATEEADDQFVALNSTMDDSIADLVTFDVKPLVDPLDELLDQKTSLI